MKSKKRKSKHNIMATVFVLNLQYSGKRWGNWGQSVPVISPKSAGDLEPGFLSWTVVDMLPVVQSLPHPLESDEQNSAHYPNPSLFPSDR